MGKKIPIDIAQKLAKLSENNSIYAPDNKYGYRININHPKIRPFYEEYKRRYKIIIMSDAERFDFESIIFKMIERKNNERT